MFATQTPALAGRKARSTAQIKGQIKITGAPPVAGTRPWCEGRVGVKRPTHPSRPWQACWHQGFAAPRPHPFLLALVKRRAVRAAASGRALDPSKSGVVAPEKKDQKRCILRLD